MGFTISSFQGAHKYQNEASFSVSCFNEQGISMEVSKVHFWDADVEMLGLKALHVLPRLAQCVGQFMVLNSWPLMINVWL